MPSTRQRRNGPASNTRSRGKKSAKPTAKPTKKSTKKPQQPRPSPAPTPPPRAIMHAVNAHRFTTPFDTDECPVCLRELEAEVSYTACGHTYCQDCLVRVMAEDNPRCPVCRRALEPAQCCGQTVEK